MQCALNRDKSLTTLGGCKETCSESKFRIITPILEILWNFPFKIILQNSRYCFEMFYLEYLDFNANLQSIIGNVNTFVKHVQRANSRSQKKKKKIKIDLQKCCFKFIYAVTSNSRQMKQDGNRMTQRQIQNHPTLLCVLK